jgi:beta-phosphoglucomutase-like phosphatase (HAD superfamily)
MLVIFDNDGTLCDTQEVEGRCYAMAIQHVTGILPETIDWTLYEEPTSSAIVRQLLAGDRDWKVKEDLIKDEFCRLLRQQQPVFPGDFSPLAGAVEVIERLQLLGISIAIATGAFDTEAQFKLKCCGIDLDAFPHATSSDTPRRADIIALAAHRAGVNLSSAVYVADGPWDVRCSQQLGVRMIGMGRRHDQLRSLGIRSTFRDYSDPAQILDAINGR